MENINSFIYQTPIGQIKISENGKAIIAITTETKINQNEMLKETKLLKTAYIQLKEYFEGKRESFNVPIEFIGTEFQISVWKALCNIPYGRTKSYKEIAEEVGCPKGARAVGMANNKNKIMIIIPCHRVIGNNGKLVGYAGGLNIKEKLLDIEKNNDNSLE